MYEKEFKFLQDNIDLVENKKFDELFSKRTYDINWENVLTICYDPEVDINPLEGMTKIPERFFANVHLPNVALVIPKQISEIDPIAFYNSEFQSVQFENPDCIVKLRDITADIITMPANSTLDDSSSNSLQDIDAKVILSKNTSYIGQNAIVGSNPNLILIWTSPNPVKMAVEYTPRNKNLRW